MKLQHYAVIFIIIVLPISFLLSEYMDSQIDEINIQNKYNKYVKQACYDAIKSFEINSNSRNKKSFKERKEDTEYLIESFYKSLANQFSLNGYDSESLKNYTPAVVLNLYDGFYMYSKYQDADSKKYEFGLRPYEKYSCRYVYEDTYDFIAQYTLDNYVSIIGLVNGEIVQKSGYFIDIRKIDEDSKNKIDAGEVVSEIYFDGLKIEKENLNTYEIEYRDSEVEEKIKNEESTSALKYYVESYKFTKWIEENLSSITPKYAVDGETGETIKFTVNQSLENNRIFSINDNNVPESKDSVFYMHKEAIIRKKIEDSLKSAIACFNEYSKLNYEFVLPKIKETDFENIGNKVNIMAFVQGLSIKGKYSNSYAVVTSNSSSEVLNNEDLIAFSKDKNFHRLNCKEVVDKSVNEDDFIIAISSKQNFKQQKVNAENEIYYYYPQVINTSKENYGECYNCIANIQNTYLLNEVILGQVRDLENNVIYSKDDLKNIRKAYFTALAREKYDFRK